MRDVLTAAGEAAYESTANAILRFVLGTGTPRSIAAKRTALAANWKSSFGCKSDPVLAETSEKLHRAIDAHLNEVSSPVERLDAFRTATDRVIEEGSAAPNSADALRRLEMA